MNRNAQFLPLALLIPFAVALGACASSVPSPSPAPLETPTSLPGPSLTPTRPAATRAAPPSPTPTPGIFRPAAFSISEVPAAAEGLSLEFDPRFTSPPAGDYLLFIRTGVNREDTGPKLAELRYASPDGLTQGRILSVRKDLSLVGASPTLNLLHLADFNQDEVVVYTVDWQQGTVRQLRLVGNPGLSVESGFWSVRSENLGNSIAFSPDGRWLVWDCEPDGEYAWCLLDLQQEAGHTIVPGGQLRYSGGSRHLAYFRWAPNSEWFLAECADLTNAGRPTQCAVFPQTQQVYRTTLTLDYRLRDGSISPQGDDLFVLLFPPLEAPDEPIQLAVLQDRCFLETDCSPRTLLSFPWNSLSSAWSPSGEQIALGLEVLNPLATKIEYLLEIRIVDVSDGSFRVLTQNLHGGLLGWFPDGRALLIAYASSCTLCSLSTEGLFRPIVPFVEGWNTHFLTWWQVP